MSVMAVGRWLRSKVVIAATLTLATVIFLYHGVERRTESVITSVKSPHTKSHIWENC